MHASAAAAVDAPAQLLWTSGWDSTFRLLHLLLVRRYPVRPIYVLDPDRASLGMELKSIARIQNALFAAFPDTRKLLRPVTLIFKSDIPLDAAVTEDVAVLRSRFGLGDQYEWLARLAKHVGAPLELSIQRVEDAADRWHVLLENQMQERDLGYGPFFEICARPSIPELRVLQGFRYPVLALTKPAMGEIARQHGFYGLLELSWFCHRPTADEKPCGTCAPCCYTREDGLGYRIGWRGNLRDKRNTLLRKLHLRK